MSKLYLLLPLFSVAIIAIEMSALVYYWDETKSWLLDNLWVGVIPFLKLIIRRLLALSLVGAVKTLLALVINLCKLLMLKFIKIVSLRYGVYFTQSRWRWVRYSKVMFLRRGKQFFRKMNRVWNDYTEPQKKLIVTAFFPVLLLLFLLGLSFNITRKTMVQKTQEGAIFQAATSASNSNKGVRAWLKRLDKKTLRKIRESRSNKK